MTTLVRTRQPLQALSMSNLPERRSKRLAGTSSPTSLPGGEAEEQEQPQRKRSKRSHVEDQSSTASTSASASAPAPVGRKKRKQQDDHRDDADPFATTKTAPAVYDEQDGDFLFTRGSKRVKTAAPEPEPEPVQASPSLPSPPPPPPPPKRAGRPPKNTSKKRVASSPPPPPLPEPKSAKIVAATPATTTRRTSKRKSSLAAAQPPPAPAPVQDEETALPKPRGRRKGRESAADKKSRLQQQQQQEEEEEEEEAAAARAQLMNGIPEEEEEEEVEQAPPSPPPQPKPKAKPRRSTQQQQQQQPTSRGTPQAPVPPTQTIALPFSDTPIQNRNKEFRKKGGNTGGRRSSLGLRGRRASSLIDNGQTALPHKTVDPSEFWKYISAEGLSEPRRMKQLLIWCGERALSAKPRGNAAGGVKGNSAILGARAIQDQILKDFGSVSEFSDWFPREDNEPEKPEKPARPVILEPNPINVQNDEKIAALEARIARLKSLKQSWSSLLLNPLPVPPSIQDAQSSSSSSSPSSAIPDSSLLSAQETEILSYLTNPTTNFGGFKRQVRSRLQNLQSNLEYEVDLLADRVHKFDMRVATGEREAEAVLRVCADRLKEREERERRRVGTEKMNVMEVLRSLGRVVGDAG